MIISFFRNNRPSVYVWLLLYTLLLRGIFLWHPVFEKPSADAFFGPFITDWVKTHNISAFSLQLADILLIYIEAILLNFILTANNIFNRSTFVPAMIFVTLASLFGEWIVASLQTVAQLFLLISLFNVFSITGKEQSRESIFYTSVFLSIGSLFYFPVSLFLVIIIVSLLMRSLSFADFMLTLVGFVLPYFFIGIAIYYGGDLGKYLYFLENHFYINAFPTIDISLGQELMLAYMLLLVVMGYLQLQGDREFKIVKHRRLVLIVLAYFALSALAGPFISGSKLEYMQLVALPGTIFVSKVFIDKLRFYHQLMFLVLLIGAVVFQLFYLKII